MYVVRSALVLLACGFLGCVKIDSFDKPHATETFIGGLEVDSSIEELSAGARTGFVLVITTDGTGKKAYISGIPPENPFYLVPTELWKELREDGLLKNVGKFDLAPNVSGLECEVVGKKTLKVTGFQVMSKLAKEMGLEVSGELIREGPQVATVEEIIISANVGKLKALLPTILLNELFHTEENQAISKLPDDMQVNLFRFHFRGDVSSPF